MSLLPPDQRPYEVVLFGATGFTGRLVAEYLARSRPRDLRWALAGRSRAKLEEVRRELVGIDPTLAELPLLLADSSDAAALATVAASCRVICTTVGPYLQHGLPLVEACAAHGTHYCDLSGEVPFVRAAIDRSHAQALASGAKIVPCCGFDSLPSDLGVHLLHEHFAAQGHSLAAARYYLEASEGGASGGTIASILNMMEQAARDPAMRRLLFDSYALNPDRQRDRGPDGRDQLSVAWDAEAGRFTGPFVMAAINTRVVRRSNALRDFAYGREFRYSEVVGFGAGPGGLLKAAGLAIGMGGFFGVASVPLLRPLLRRVLPKSGEGPSRAQQEKGHFRVRILGHSPRPAAAAPYRASVVIKGHRDPGYGETSRMIAEAALCLARDPLPAAGGVLTPAVAMGGQLIERLRKFGMVWDVSTSA